MFTDLLNLPLNSDRASQSDQILSLSNMNWSDYERLVETQNSYRTSYLNGEITNEEYVQIEKSICLPELSAIFLISFINRGLTETPY